MDNLLAAGIGTFILAFAILGSIVALILWGCAVGIGKIEKANFGNAWLIFLFAVGASFVFNIIVGYIVPNLVSVIGIKGILFYQVITNAIFYISGGKLIWKCEWEQSMKAYSVLFTLHVILCFIASNVLQGMMETFQF